MAQPILQIRQMNKWYGNFHALKDIDLEVTPGEKIVICGPSGSGKSTLIRCINRLEKHQEGDLVFDGTTMTESAKGLEAIRRNVGMVFQQFNLFPHMTVLETALWRRFMCCNAQSRSRGGGAEIFGTRAYSRPSR